MAIHKRLLVLNDWMGDGNIMLKEKSHIGTVSVNLKIQFQGDGQETACLTSRTSSKKSGGTRKCRATSHRSFASVAFPGRRTSNTGTHSCPAWTSTRTTASVPVSRDSVTVSKDCKIDFYSVFWVTSRLETSHELARKESACEIVQRSIVLSRTGISPWPLQRTFMRFYFQT